MGRTKKGKGSGYERVICKDLSLWWTLGKRDDVFWRSAASGARATIRGNRSTAGHYGDIMSTDPCSAPFMAAFTVEIKRGYNSHTLHDALDCNATSAVQTWQAWLHQVVYSWQQSGSLSWLLITKRDQRAPLVTMPKWTEGALGLRKLLPGPYAMAQVYLDQSHTQQAQKLFTCPLQHFLNHVTPNDVRKLT